MNPPSATPPPDLVNLLKKAIFAGSEAAIRGYLRQGGQPDARDSNGMTLLMLAASRDQAAICTHLLAAGANPVLSLSASHPLTALEIAQRTRSLTAMPVLEQAVQRESAGMLLRRAAAVGSVLAVQRHIQRGDNLNATGRSGLTPLMLAALKNHAEICAALYQAGADAALLSPAGLTACELAAEAHANEAWAVLSPPPAAPVAITPTAAPPVLTQPLPEAAAPIAPAAVAVTPTATIAPPAVAPPMLPPPVPEAAAITPAAAPIAVIPTPPAAAAPENIPSPPVLAQEAVAAPCVTPTPADWAQVLDDLLSPLLVAENATPPVADLEWVRPTWVVGLPVAWAQALADLLSPYVAYPTDTTPPEPAVIESADAPPLLPAPSLEAVQAQEAADSAVHSPSTAPASIAVADAADQAEETEDVRPLLLPWPEPAAVESAEAALVASPPLLPAPSLEAVQAQEAADTAVSPPSTAPASIAVADAAEQAEEIEETAEAHPLLPPWPEPAAVESAEAPPLEEELPSLFCWEAREEPCLPEQDEALVLQSLATWQQIAAHTPRQSGVEWFDASLAAVTTAEEDAYDTASTFLRQPRGLAGSHPHLSLQKIKP